MENEQAQASHAQDVIGNTMTAENAKQILSSRKLITEPGKYQLKVTNVTPFDRPVAGGDSILTNIVNFAAMTPYLLAQAKADFKAGNYQGATNQSLTASRRTGMDFSPKKGDIVEVIVDYVALRDLEPWAGTEADPTNPNEDPRFPEGRKNQLGLLVVGVQPIPLTAAKNVVFNFDDEEVDTQAEAGLIDPDMASIRNRKASISAAEAKGAGAPSAKIGGTTDKDVQVDPVEELQGN